MRGVRGENDRVLGARPVAADGMHVLVELVEGRMRQPGLVEMQRVDGGIQRLLQHLDVVDHAVVGALGDGEDARLLALGRARERVGLDLLLDVLRAELLQRNRADDAQVIALRREEHGNRAGHGDRVQDRHVAVAVDDDDVVRRDVRVPDHLVRGRSAVGDEEAMIGAEDARGIALRGRHRPGVVEQLAEFVHRVAHVGAQHVLAEELVEHLPHRAFQERHAARVARAMPGVRAVLRVMHQRAEERRRQPVEVGARLADDVARDELRRVLEHVDEAVQLAQDVVRHVARGARLAVEVDRDIGVAKADLLDEGAQVQHRRIEFRTRRELLVVDRQDECRRAALLLRELRQIAVARHPEHFHALVFHRLGERADAQPAGVLGTEVLVDDDDGKAKFHAVLRNSE